MSIQATFYNTKSSPETVNKVLTDSRQLSIELKAPTDVLSPVIVLGGVDITGYNYCYIPAFKRYYYIDEMETDYGNITGRKCSVDVLMTYKSQIKQLNAIVERQQNYYNLYLNDLQIPDYAYKRIQTKQFPQQPLNVAGTMLLAVMGKG